MIERINREFGTDRTNILNLTMYCTRLSELGSALRTVFAPWAGDHRPTVTAIGVAALGVRVLRMPQCAKRWHDLQPVWQPLRNTFF